MSTVKISQLPFITELNANTEKTLMAGVDLVSGLTGKISVRTLAEGLYSNDVLNVGTNPIILENVVAQFTDSSSEYIQINLQNFDGVGSSDYVASANNSDGSNNYIDMGINGPGFNDPVYSSMLPYDGYVYSHGPSHNDYRGNLVIGTASSNANVVLIAGGTQSNNIVGRFNANKFNFFNQVDITDDLVVTGNVYVDNIIFGDNSIQETSLTNRLDAAFLKANNALANVANATFGFSLTSPQTITANILTAVHRLGFSANGLIRTETGTGNFKNLSLLTGDEVSTGNSGTINITTGSGGAVSGYGGDINVTPGRGNSGSGKVNINVASNVWTFGVDSTIKFPDNSLQYTAAAPFSYSTASYGHANSAHTQANAAFIHANNAYEHANAGYNATNATYIFANSAYYLAAGALANTTGTFAGDLNITGNLKTSGVVTLNNSTFSPDAALLSIVASDNFATVPPSNTNYMIHVTGKANSVTRVVVDSFGANTYPLYTGRMGRGSASAPSAVANNDVLFRITGNGHTGSQFPSSSPTKVDFVASENFSDTNRGTRIEFWNTPVGSNTIQKIANFNAESVEFTGAVKPNKGFIYTPNVLTNGATTLTIDFTRDSLVKCNSASGLTVTLSNYVYGKEVILWFTNSGGSTQSVTHGCLANNSTTGSTSFSMAAGSTAMLRYFSIDGSLGDTFVAVTQG